MSTVQLETRTGSAAPAAVSTPCRTFSWCATTAPDHVTHQSAPVPLPGDGERLVFAETDPDSGALLYGPVLSCGDSDEPVGFGRVLAAQLRVAAARVDELVAAVELAGGAV